MVSFTKLGTFIIRRYDENVHIYLTKKSKSSKDKIDVELEIHTTCLDDSCWYEYHILEFERGMDNGWLIVSHKKGNRCYEDRGGGSPPCL